MFDSVILVLVFLKTLNCEYHSNCSDISNKAEIKMAWFQISNSSGIFFKTVQITMAWIQLALFNYYSARAETLLHVLNPTYYCFQFQPSARLVLSPEKC